MALDMAWKKRHSDHRLIHLDDDDDDDDDLDGKHTLSAPGSSSNQKSRRDRPKKPSRGHSRRHTSHTLSSIRLLGNHDDDSSDSEASFFEDASEEDDLTIATFVTCSSEPKDAEDTKEKDQPLILKPSVEKTLLNLLQPKETESSKTARPSIHSTNKTIGSSTNMKRASSFTNALLLASHCSSSNLPPKRSSCTHQVLFSTTEKKESVRQSKSFDEKKNDKNTKYIRRARVSSPQIQLSTDDLRVLSTEKPRPSRSLPVSSSDHNPSTRTSLAILKLGQELNDT